MGEEGDYIYIPIATLSPNEREERGKEEKAGVDMTGSMKRTNDGGNRTLSDHTLTTRFHSIQHALTRGRRPHRLEKQAHDLGSE